MASALRVKGSTLRSLALVAPSQDPTEPSTWKLLERPRAKGSAATVEVDGAAPVGDLLRRTRRRRRISLRQAAADTCIPARYIEALERDLPLRAFPGAVYARGFLRTYARYLRISDIEAVVHRFDDDPPPPVQAWSALNPVERRDRSRRNGLVLVVLALFAASVAVAAEGGPRRHASHRPAALGLLPAAAPNADRTNARVGADRIAPPRPGTAAPGALSVTVSVLDRSSWLLVSADGSTVFAGRVVPAGFVHTFSAERTLQLTVGNAGAVRLLVGGVWSQPLGAPGVVRRIVVTISNGIPSVQSSGTA